MILKIYTLKLKDHYNSDLLSLKIKSDMRRRWTRRLTESGVSLSSLMLWRHRSSVGPCRKCPRGQWLRWSQSLKSTKGGRLVPCLWAITLKRSLTSAPVIGEPIASRSLIDTGRTSWRLGSNHNTSQAHLCENKRAAHPQTKWKKKA